MDTSLSPCVLCCCRDIYVYKQSIACKNKLTHEEQLLYKVNDTYHHCACEASVHSCTRSLWCTSLAPLQHVSPHVHSCGRLAAQWLRESDVDTVALTWRHRAAVTDVLPSSEMIELDGDDERISSQGRYAERDIVQVRMFASHVAEGLGSTVLYSL